MAHLEISCERGRLDRDMIQRFLSQTHWAQGLTPEQLDKAIAHSLVFGAYRGQRQLGFARIVTDYASFAYLSDVFVLAEVRRLGVGRALMEAALAHPELQQLRRFLLVSRDARPFYRRLGFAELRDGERYMELRRGPAAQPARAWSWFRANKNAA
ncbi:GNAT family N-acetyltransferase [Chromobacterium sp. Panama]|uniref:GNAT family N-acetyltransferase n=1 Tax=Chromobacterium sp. Panama TaxID=2161826 RepID=UPI000D300605|nr:GNAT family N-acetyltransferase [Chromobacterium sp. Panama]PTU67202.1 GNAT family N-acetyltransferase [Chromobacterium sp. Panama]